VPQHDNALPFVPNRNYTRSQLANRRRYESECGKCFSNLDDRHNSSSRSSLFPEIMQQTLDQAQASESRLLNYIASFRLVKWSLRLMTPVTLPFDFLLLTVRTFKAWIDSSSKKDFFVQRLQTVVDFILAEIESQKVLHPKISCQLAVTELTTGGSAKPTSPTDKRRHMSVHPVEEVAAEYTVNDEDSVAHLVDYSLQHDAVMAFYYTNETNNQLEVCEIFDMDRPKRTRDPNTNLKRKHTLQSPTEVDEADMASQPSTSGVFSEENANANAGVTRPVSPQAGEDSGLSLTEDSSNGNVVKKRDACCSPVRRYGSMRSAQRANSQRTSASHGTRRHTFNGARKTTTSSLHSLHSLKNPGHHSSSSSVKRPTLVSSDSDGDAGEVFFVSNPRKRTDSNDYDGEPEQSDTDQGC
jgi:hypothetical protein